MHTRVEIVGHDLNKHWRFIVDEDATVTLRLWIRRPVVFCNSTVYGMLLFIYHDLCIIDGLVYWKQYFGT